jgi:hypothetical protein
MIHPRWHDSDFWQHMERETAKANRKLAWNNAAYHRKKARG